jgi:hypothetical protein
MQVLFSFVWWIYFCMFFSGYPLVYILFYFIGKRQSMHHVVAEKLFPMLPLAYAFVATGFWVLVIYTGRMNFVIQRIFSTAPSALIILYSFSSLLFFLPAFRKNIYLSFLHSLPLFMLPFYYIFSRGKNKVVDHEDILSLIRIYAAGFIVYIFAMILLLVFRWLLRNRAK